MHIFPDKYLSRHPDVSSDVAPGRSSRLTSDLHIAAILTVSVLFLYMAVSRHEHVAYDASVMAAVTHNLVNHRTLRTTGALIDHFRFNTPYSQYGVGVSIALVPFYVAAKLWGNQGFWESLLNPVLVAASVGVLYLIGRALRWSRLASVLAALTFGTLTMALQSTTELLSEPGVALCVLMVVLAMVRWRDGWKWSPLLLGVGLGAAIQFRTDSLFTVGVALLALPFFVPRSQLLSPRALLWAGTPLLLSLAFLGWYNSLRYGHPFVTSYTGVNGRFNTPLAIGLKGLLVSPGRGLFVYNIIAIPGLIGLALLWGKDRALALLTVLLIVPRVIFFARWDQWTGGVCWGPRFLMPVVSLFVLGAFSLTLSTGTWPAVRRPGRLMVAIAALLSVPVSYLSVRVPYEQWNNAFVNPVLRSAIPVLGKLPLVGGNLFYHEIWAWPYSIIHGNYLLLRVGKAQMAPALWRFHHGSIGWLLLFGFAAGAGLVIAAATFADRSERLEDFSRPVRT